MLSLKRMVMDGGSIKDIILGETTEKQREMPKLRIKIYIFLRNDF